MLSKGGKGTWAHQIVTMTQVVGAELKWLITTTVEYVAISILAGVFFLYLSAKWVRIAWGKEAGLFWEKNTSESTIECLMEISLWGSILLFGFGLFLTIYFFTNYSGSL